MALCWAPARAIILRLMTSHGPRLSFPLATSAAPRLRSPASPAEAGRSPSLRRCAYLAALGFATLGLVASPTFGGIAHAAEPEDEPLLDDLDRARPLAPPPGALTGTLEAQKQPEPKKVEPGAPREVLMVVAHGRWSSIPSALFDLPFSVHPGGISTAGIGVGIEFGDLDDTMWAVDFDWTPLFPKAGNWLEASVEPIGANYVEDGLHLISIDVVYRRQFRFTSGFRAMLGGGLGVGILAGNLQSTEVLPTCQDPVAECAHWPTATREAAELPTRVIPILHFTAGLEVDLGAGLSLRAQAGFRDLLYAGLSIGAQL